MTPGAGVLMLEYGHLSHYTEYVVYSTLSIYSTLLCQGIMMLLSYTIVDYHYFYDGAVDIQI